MPAKKKTPLKRGRPRKIVEPSITDVPAHDSSESAKPATVDVLITGSYPNAMWLKGVDKAGKLYKIRVPKRFSDKLLHKQITVQSIDGELEEYYKYEP